MSTITIILVRTIPIVEKSKALSTTTTPSMPFKLWQMTHLHPTSHPLSTIRRRISSQTRPSVSQHNRVRVSPGPNSPDTKCLNARVLTRQLRSFLLLTATILSAVQFVNLFYFTNHAENTPQQNGPTNVQITRQEKSRTAEKNSEPIYQHNQVRDLLCRS